MSAVEYMTGVEHIQEARRLLANAARINEERADAADVMTVLAAAQVHATLALVEATLR